MMMRRRKSKEKGETPSSMTGKMMKMRVTHLRTSMEIPWRHRSWWGRLGNPSRKFGR